jgi:hypothetical protein
MKNLGDGMRAIRRHGGTALVIYGVQRKDFKKIRILLAAEGIFVPDMTRLKRCGFFTTAQYHEEDWKSPSGRISEEKTWFLKAVVPYSQASYGAKGYAGDLKRRGKRLKNNRGKGVRGGKNGGPHRLLQLSHGPQECG